MTLELKHLAPYLPYGLKMISTFDLHEDYEDIADDYSELLNKGNVFELYLLTTESIEFYGGDCDDFAVKSERIRLSNAGCFKPILRPLSDLKRENEKYFFHFDNNEGLMMKRENETFTRLNELDFLFENHYDVFGLIPQGLAIDINTIQS